MHDSYLLPRTLKKLNKNVLNTKNSSFKKSFIKDVYDCFLKNAELDINYDQMYVYSIYANKVIRKYFNEIGLGEICIVQPIRTNDFWTIIKSITGEEIADHILSEIANVFRVSLEDVKNR